MEIQYDVGPLRRAPGVEGVAIPLNLLPCSHPLTGPRHAYAPIRPRRVDMLLLIMGRYTASM